MLEQLPSDILPRTRQLLQPFVNTLDDREALITEAFFLHDPLLSSISLDGNQKIFCVRLIQTLLKHGCLPTKEHSLARLLTTLRYDCDDQHYPEIDKLIELVNVICAESTTPRVTPSTVTPIQTAPITISTPIDERKPTVFISYSHQDNEIAETVVADLNLAGHACWIDTTKIKGGDEWILTIAEGIINSYVFVPLVTLKALQSKWVQDEILWARQKNKLIIPLILEDVLSEHLFFPLVSYQGVTVFDSDYETSVAKLISYLPNPTLIEVEDISVPQEDDEPDAPPVTGEQRAIPRKLELAYMERLRFEELLNTEKYTAMGGVSQQIHQRVQMRPVFELLPMGDTDDEPDIDLPKERFEDAVAEIQRIRQAVLLGEPGGGKTTTLWKLAADLVDKALIDRDAVIPILIRLGKWTDGTQPLQAFIASQMGDLGFYLDQLLRDRRVALLLDGLNEIPASQHSSKYKQVRDFVSSNRDLLSVVSCRELDYTINLGFNKINITPLDPIRIREFVNKYLGDTGDDLFWKLAGEKAQKRYEEFLDEFGDKIENPEHTFWLANKLPDKLWSRYWFEWLREREHPSGLMVLARNPYMLLMLTSVFAKQGELPENRGALFHSFVETLLEREGIQSDEKAELIQGLSDVAFTMQIRRSEEKRGDGLTVLPQDDVKAMLGDRLFYLAGSASILTVGEQVRFTHQLLQEYFAARTLLLQMQADEAENTHTRAFELFDQEKWWELGVWRETIVILGEFLNEEAIGPNRVARWLAPASPEAAVQVVMRNRTGLTQDDIDEETRRAIVDGAIEQLENEHSTNSTYRALKLVGEYGNLSDATVVYPYLENISRDIRETALTALDSLEWQPTTNNEKAFYWVGKLKTNVRFPFADMEAIERIVQLGDDAVRALWVNLSAREIGTRFLITHLLTTINSEASVTALTQLEEFTRANLEIRQFVALALGYTTREEATMTLNNLTASDEHNTVRYIAILSIGRRNLNTLSTVIEFCFDTNQRIREATAWALMMQAKPNLEPLPHPLFDDISETKTIDVLGVDDEPESIKLMEAILGVYGFTNIHTASNGIEALRIIDDKNINLIITNWLMPYMDGFQLVEHIRGMNVYIDIILSTAASQHSLPEIEVEAVISKPWKIPVFILTTRLIAYRNFVEHKLRVLSDDIGFSSRFADGRYDAYIWNTMMYALITLGDEAIDPLISVVTNLDNGKQAEAYQVAREVLETINTPKAKNALKQLPSSD